MSSNKNKDIIIKPADKGSAIVILDKQSYINEGQRLLHNTQFYKETQTSLVRWYIELIYMYTQYVTKGSTIPKHL